MILYRVVSRRQNANLSGRGSARSKVNRWNSHGTELIYTSESRELAITEISSYIPIGLLPDPHLLVIVVDRKASITELDESDYPEKWDDLPSNDRTRILGDRFVTAMESIGLKVKSRHSSSGCTNVLLNPNHPDFKKFVSIKDVIALKK